MADIVNFLMKIPFERKIAEAYSKGIPLVDAIPDYRDKFRSIFKLICEMTNATDCNY